MWPECRSEHPTDVTCQRLPEVACPCVPDERALVAACADDRTTVAAEPDAGDARVVATVPGAKVLRASSQFSAVVMPLR